jgi:putative acetyltransferase
MIRRAQELDYIQIDSLVSLAFGSTAEVDIIHNLKRNDDAIAGWVKTQKGTIIGYLQFYKIKMRDYTFAGLGPVCIHPDFQRKGHGKALIEKAIEAVKSDTPYPLLFVLGHPDYYPQFGFSSRLGNQFIAPWSGPSFMALPLQNDHPEDGTLTFPKAFG